jgi:hypothetical protein
VRARKAYCYLGLPVKKPDRPNRDEGFFREVLC